MAVKKIWQITHSCGHTAERDLDDRPTGRRAGFAEWLATQECTECWRAAKEGDDSTEKGIAWGVRCRHQVLSAS
ncbi:hypothetical protein ACFV4F_37630 [Kitasatospora sp. NPDC059722]|uniref:hypothetical protein n=1 Tax=Kitasatospora sp. NPDC059722 TaxID=3346925 RepID=UPI0036A33F07